MEGSFTELPEEKREILRALGESLKSMITGGIDHKGELFQPTEWKGYRFIPSFRPETAERYFNEIEIEDNTVFLFSYPKTGTSWTTEVIGQILYGHNEKLYALWKDLPPMLMMLEFWTPSKLDLYEHVALSRKFISSHLPAGLVDFEKLKKGKAKIIIPIRNPKDQAISWFHFTQNEHFDAIRDVISPEWSQFFLDYVQGRHPTISKSGEWYPEFLLSWYKYKDEDNVMFLHFEDMKKNPQDEIRRMARFLDVELSEDRASAIAKATSFNAMRAAQEKGENLRAKGQASFQMMRKGQAGAWKNTFTVAQSELMDKIIADKLGGSDINFRYE